MNNYWNLSLLSFSFSLVEKCWDFRNEPDLLPWSLLPTSFYSSQSQQLLVYFRSLRSRFLLRRSIDRVLSGDFSRSQTGIPIKQGSQIKTLNQNESRCYTHHLMKLFYILFEIHIYCLTLMFLHNILFSKWLHFWLFLSLQIMILQVQKV